MLNDHDIREFQLICREELNLELDTKDAREQAARLLELYHAIYIPIHKSQKTYA